MTDSISIKFDFRHGLTEETCERLLHLIRSCGGEFEGDSGIITTVYGAESGTSPLEEIEITEAAEQLASKKHVDLTTRFDKFDIYIRQNPEKDSNNSSGLMLTTSYHPFQQLDETELWKDYTRSFLDVVGDLASGTEPTLGYGARGKYPLEYTVSSDELAAERPAVMMNINLWGPGAVEELDLLALEKFCFYVRELDSGHVLFAVHPLAEWVNDANASDQTLVDVLDVEFGEWASV